MTNVVTFPPNTAPVKNTRASARKPAKAVKKGAKTSAPYRIYYVSDLTTAVHIAGILYQDLKAVKKLHAELEDRFAKNELLRGLHPNLLATCSR